MMPMPPNLPYESIFNRGPAANCLLSPTPEALILAVNDAYLTVTSRTRKELVGKSIYDAFPDNPEDLQDSGEAALRRCLSQVVETRLPQTMPAQRYPIRVQLSDGHIGFQERYWSAVSTPVFDELGNFLCISHVISDVSEKLRSEAALRDSEARFRGYVTATSDVVYRMSPDWAYMDPLDGRGFLKTTKSWAEYRIKDYVYSEDVALATDAIQTAIRDKAVFELEHRVWRADGSVGWTYSRAVPLLDADGEIREWVGAASDITERKLVELKLQETDRRKDEFLAMLAHELRNPLAPISSAAELMLRMDLDRERMRRTSEIIARQVRHMTNLVDDLLDVSRVTRGLVTLAKMPLDVSLVVSNAIEQSSPLIQARRQHLSVHLAAEKTLVTGDSTRLTQVVANLVNNAAKYTPEGGNIVVRTQADGADVLLEVIDDGIGMDARLVNHAFELFAQAEVTSDRSLGGLGLGLALVKSLVELHGGTVACQSAGVGRGSSFTVRLPQLIEAAPAGQAAHPGQAAAGQSRPLRLLVVDDNMDAAEMLSMLLEAAGHQVFFEHSPRRGLERARIELPDVCILDIGLPEMDGYELARRLHAQPENADAVLIALTGYGQDDDRAQSAAAGFAHHFVKPLDTANLLNVLEHVVGRNTLACLTNDANTEPGDH